MDSRLRGKDGYGRVLQRSPEGERFKAAAGGGEAGGEGAHKGRPYGTARAHAAGAGLLVLGGFPDGVVLVAGDGGGELRGL